MNDPQTAELQVTEPRNERCTAVDQTMELARMLPESAPERIALLRKAASLHRAFFTPMVICSPVPPAPHP